MQLTERERNNPKFSFLIPGDSKFNVFCQFIEAYKHCFNLGKKQLRKLKFSLKNKMSILDRVMLRYEYESM